MRNAVEIKGLDKVIKKIVDYPAEVQKQVDILMGDQAKEMVSKVVNDVPVDESFLKQSIQDERLGIMNYNVAASAGYAPYMEFGTKKKFNNPYPSIDSAQFKGGGGGKGGGFFAEILAWVKRKGFAAHKTASGRTSKSKASQEQERQVAYLIYRHIAIYGVKPHPFFFKHYFTASQNILKGIRQIIKDMK